MAGSIKREPDALSLQFERDGEEPERKLAHGGRQALLFAIGMLIGHTRLLAGDRLTVSAADGKAESSANR